MSEKTFVTYEEFGAVGNGVANDFAAIYAAHIYANEKNLPVRARDGATYYIHEPLVNGELIRAIPVHTNVNWGAANFILDDRDISAFPKDPFYAWRGTSIFKIISDYEPERIEDEAILNAITEAGLAPGTKKVPLKFDYPVMIVPYDTSVKVFKRRGYGSWAGDAKHEIIVLDTEGNVSEETPLIFEYNRLDYVTVYRIDDAPLVIEGGIFTTRASRCNMLYKDENGEQKLTDMYVSRGLSICRSNTLVKGVQHYITDEVTLAEQVNEKGEIVWVAPCYGGFYSASGGNHITFEDCIMTGRRCYRRPEGGAGGTYGLSGGAVNKIVFKNCHQSNFWVTVDEDYNIHPAKEGDPGALASMSAYTVNGTPLMMHWGIGGTNFCKNMEYIGSTLSRFDAHCGLYNGKIIDSSINGMEIVGNGTLHLENSKWYSQGGGVRSGPRNALFYLRDDYASTWHGELIVRDFDIFATINETTRAFLFYHSYSNWDYGYQAYFPNLTVENLRYYDFNTREPMPEGTRIYLVGGGIDREPAMHAKYTKNTDAIFPDVDADGDGLVDGTKIPYDDVVDKRGVIDVGNKINNNPIIPPEHIKILGNTEAGYEFVVHDTSECEDGGFFGTTEFISDRVIYHGTAHKQCETFCFEKVEYPV